MQWLIATFKLVPTIGIRVKLDALNSCCQSGNLQLARWWVDTLHMTREDLVDKRALYTCCENGNLKMVQWLVNTFQLTCDNHALYTSTVHGHAEVYRWLADTTVTPRS